MATDNINAVELEDAYLVDLGSSPLQKLKFPHLPESLGWERTANYNPVDVIGRSSQVYQYSSTTTRSFNLELKFYASIHQSDGGDPTRYVLDKLKWLESLALPDYDRVVARPPHPVLFKIGSWLSVRCLVQSVASEVQGPWEVETLLPYYGTSRISMVEVPTTPWGYREVRQNRDRHGYSRQSAPRS